MEKEVKKGETIEVAKKVAAGVPPSNVELVHVIDTTIEGLEKEKKEQPPMTKKEEKVVQDVEEVLKSAKTLIQEKNVGEPLQKIFVHAAAAGATTIPAAAALGLAGIPTGAMSAEARNALNALNQLLWKLVQSEEFRGDLKELFNLMSEIIFYDASGNLRSSAQPLQEVLEGKKSVAEGVRESFEKAKFEVQQAAASTAAAPSTSFGGGAAPTFGEPLIPAAVPTTWGQAGYTSGLPTAVQAPGLKTGDTRNDALIDRFTKLLTHLSSTQEYRTMVREVNALFDQLRFTFEKSPTVDLAAKKVEQDPHILELRRNVRLLIEQFAGNRSLEPLIQHFKNLIDSICDDAEVRQWFYDFRYMISEVVEHPEKLNDPWFREYCSGLIDRGRALANSYRWHEQFELVRKDIEDIVNRISRDPQLVQFQSSLDKLVKDLTVDEYGRVSLNTAAIERLRMMFVPLLLHHLQEIPLPRIEESTEKLDYWVDNIYLSGEELAPERITIKLKARTDILPKELETVQDKAILKIYVSDFAIHIPHLTYWFRRKTFPKVEDTGTATVDLRGKGVSAKIILTTDDKLGPRFFNIKKVSVDFSSVKFNIEESQHPVLMGIMTTLFKGRFKSLVEERIEFMLWNIVETINYRLAAALEASKEQIPSLTGKLQSTLQTAAAVLSATREE